MKSRIKHRVHIALDLEFNQPSEKIIQIGVVAGDPLSGQIYEELSLYVNPGEQLNPNIETLTAITDKQLATAPDLSEQLMRLNALFHKYDAKREAIVWGVGDTNMLYEQKPADMQLAFMRRMALDAKSVYRAYAIKHGLKSNKNLVDALHNCGLKFEGRPHDALNDARATFKIAEFLIREFKKDRS